MANGNVYAPLYNSVQARGRLSPLGTPGAIKPYEKEKAFGDKMAGALGDMIDQAGESKKAMKKEQIAQLEIQFGEMEKVLNSGKFITEGGDPMHGQEVWVWNDPKDNRPAPTPRMWDEFFAIKGQLGQLKGDTKYADRKPSVFDFEFTDTAKPSSNGIFGNAFRSIMGI